MKFQFINRTREEITFPLIKGCAILVFPGSRNPFTLAELDALQQYLDDGGSIFVLLAEGTLVSQCNINIFLEKYGIVPNTGKTIICGMQHGPFLRNLF